MSRCQATLAASGEKSGLRKVTGEGQEAIGRSIVGWLNSSPLDLRARLGFSFHSLSANDSSSSSHSSLSLSQPFALSLSAAPSSPSFPLECQWMHGHPTLSPLHHHPHSVRPSSFRRCSPLFVPALRSPKYEPC